jgi:hypothetical protein
MKIVGDKFEAAESLFWRAQEINWGTFFISLFSWPLAYILYSELMSYLFLSSMFKLFLMPID